MASSTNGKITVPNENLPKEETETEPKRGTKKKLLRIQASLHEESIQMVIVIEILECPIYSVANFWLRFIAKFLRETP